MPEIHDLLRQDHDKVKTVLAKLLETCDGSEKTREKLFSQVEEELELHTRFEEDEMFPQAQETLDQEAAEQMGDQYQKMQKS